jgi:hypothetical protein
MFLGDMTMSAHQSKTSLECAECGTVRMDFPADGFDDEALVLCSSCQKTLGTWGAIRAEFIRQTAADSFLLDKGRFNRP